MKFFLLTKNILNEFLIIILQKTIGFMFHNNLS